MYFVLLPVIVTVGAGFFKRFPCFFFLFFLALFLQLLDQRVQVIEITFGGCFHFEHHQFRFPQFMLFERIVLVGLNLPDLLELFLRGPEYVNILVLFRGIQFGALRLLFEDSVDFFNDSRQIWQFDIPKETMFQDSI